MDSDMDLTDELANSEDDSRRLPPKPVTPSAKFPEVERKTIDKDAQQRDHESHSSTPSEEDESSENEESEDEAVVISLVEGRQRRSTAGNRLSTLLEKEGEGEDDEVAMLFAEDGNEDVEFEDPDAADVSDDRDDDSSTDDEDQGPTAVPGEDDLEGERELKKQEQNERKRKATKPFLKAPTVRKRVKIDESATPTSTTAQPPRRKLDRRTWDPTSTHAPMRTSSRTLSVQNKARTIASMKETEKKRKKQLAAMEATQKRKDAEKNRVMTQEERLAEAARTEELNSNSLTRWEEMEKDRLARQRARLDAMQNRKLEGPVIRWFSGTAEWIDGILKTVGKPPKVEELPEESQPESEQDPEQGLGYEQAGGQTNTQIGAHETDARKEVVPTDTNKSPTSAQEPGIPASLEQKEGNGVEHEIRHVSGDVTESIEQPKIANEVKEADSSHSSTQQPESGAAGDQSREEATPIVEDPAPESNALPTQDSEDKNDVIMLDGIEQYALGEEPAVETDASQSQKRTSPPVSREISTTEAAADRPKSVTASEFQQIPTQDTLVHGSEKPVDAGAAKKASEDSPAANSRSQDAPSNQQNPVQGQAGANEDTDKAANAAAPEPEPGPESVRAKTPVIERSARNLVTFLNFNSQAIRDKDVQRRVLFGWRHDQIPPTVTSARGGAKLASLQAAPRSTCAITHQSARYRDPETSLPYANLEAYRAIRRLVTGGCKWSDLLEAWVGGEVPLADGTGRVISAARGVPPGFEKALPPRPASAENTAAGLGGGTGDGASGSVNHGASLPAGDGSVSGAPAPVQLEEQA